MESECQLVCEVKDLVAVPALSIRTRTSMQKSAPLFDAGYRDILQLLSKQGRYPVGAPFARYFNMNMNELEIEFGYPVDDNAMGDDRIVKSSTLSGKAASCLYTGCCDGMEPAYEALLMLVFSKGLNFTGDAYEIYLDDPALTPSDRRRTQVHLLLREA
jgi:effector-binding domain-containing protein